MSKHAFSKTRVDQLHEVMARYVENGIVPGLVALISRAGNTHVDTIGNHAIGTSAPMARDTIFRISSMTKPITAVAALMLIEECVLRLDDPVDELLPELANRRVIKDFNGPLDDTVPANRPITTRDLLTFRSGHGMAWAPPGESPLVDATEAIMPMGPPQPARVPAPDEWMRQLATLPLVHQPGEQCLYNTGSDILGVLIARASGRRLDQFFSERIFEPLGMRDAGFAVKPKRRDRFPTSYLTNEDGSLSEFDAPGGQWAATPAFASGGGGLVSTVDDYLTFVAMLANGGTGNGERIISRPAVELMTTDQLTPANKAFPSMVPGFWDDTGWGFGVSVTTRRTDLYNVGTYGWAGGLGTAWTYDPVEDLQAILLTQGGFTSPSSPPIVRDFVTSAYAALGD